MLISFCRGNNIKTVNGKQKKDDLVNTIINHKKHGPIRTKIAKSLTTKKSKATRPLCITKEGSLYRVIVTITCASTRSIYLETMKSRSRSDLDRGLLPHKSLWESLSQSYNEQSNDELNHLGDSTGKYTLFLKKDDGPDNYDILNKEEMSSTVAYINHHYGVARRNKNQSGQHSDFEDFIQGKGWLNFYHDRLLETGDTALMDGAYAQLPADVFLASDMGQGESSSSSQLKRSTSPGFSRSQINKAKRAAEDAVKEKNREIAKVANNTLKVNQQKRFEELSDEIFELSEVCDELKDDTTKKRERRHYKKRMSRLKKALDDLKQDMKYKEDYSESFDSSSISD